MSVLFALLASKLGGQLLVLGLDRKVGANSRTVDFVFVVLVALGQICVGVVRRLGEGGIKSESRQYLQSDEIWRKMH